MRHESFIGLLCLTSVAAAAAGCGGDDHPAAVAEAASSSASSGAGAGGGGGSGAAGGSGGSASLELVWEACPLFSDGTGPEAECARPDLPLRAAEPDGETLAYYVKRYAKPGSPRTTQMWMLSGGPGASGIIYERRAELLAEQDETLEIYIPDHRGVGDSTRLGCPDQEADASNYGFIIAPTEWKKCFTAVSTEWGDRLTAFNVTNAANDVALLVEATRRPDARVFVYGASYGTFWGHRYLQMFPDQPDGIILDAIAPPDASLARQDQHADESSADLFQACVDDPACGARLGGDPRAFALDLYARFDSGHCPAIQTLGPARVLMRRALGQMMMSWNARKLIPAALVRGDRCNADDAAALNTLFDYYFLIDATKELLYREWGWVQSNYIVFSELWETPEPTTEQMKAWRDAAAVSRDITGGFDAPLEVFTRYPTDPYFQQFARADTPLLMLQGTWDPATRPGPASVLRDAYTGAQQYWVEIARGAHGALGSVPTTDGRLCGTEILLSFLKDPSAPPDDSCLAEVEPMTFEGDAELNTLLFGTESTWGDE